MIRFLQTPGKTKKIVLGGMLVLICGAMVITLVPGGILGDAFGFGAPQGDVLVRVGEPHQYEGTGHAWVSADTVRQDADSHLSLLYQVKEVLELVSPYHFVTHLAAKDFLVEQSLELARDISAEDLLLAVHANIDQPTDV